MSLSQGGFQVGISHHQKGAHGQMRFVIFFKPSLINVRQFLGYIGEYGNRRKQSFPFGQALSNCGMHLEKLKEYGFLIILRMLRILHSRIVLKWWSDSKMGH
jgi:hypothetical protein